MKNDNPEACQLKQALVDCDATARERGDKFGLCDSVDNDGRPYPSAWLCAIIETIKAEGYLPTRTIEEAQHADAWQKMVDLNFNGGNP